jgi:hypothetical protein
MIGDSLLSEILAYYKHKVDNNLCTPEEMASAEKALLENMTVYGTADDFAQFFGKSKDAVNGIIKRNVLEKPRRNVVLHSFQAFIKRVPETWKKH